MSVWEVKAQMIKMSKIMIRGTMDRKRVSKIDLEFCLFFRKQKLETFIKENDQNSSDSEDEYFANNNHTFKRGNYFRR